MFRKISKIFKYFLTFFILFITFYTIYKSEYVEAGFLRVTYIINYIIVALLIIFLIIFNFSKIENQKNLLIFYFTTVFVLFLSEVWLQDYLKEKNYQNIQINLDKKKQAYLKNFNKVFDTRSKYEIYQNKKDEGYFLNVTPSNYLGQNKQILPLSGISNSKIITCNENGYYSTYTSDNYGFNNLYKEWPKKIDYFLLGDSFINGSCVNETETITFNLIKNFDFKKKIINAGMAGNGPLLEYASFKEFSRDKEINNLILFYYEGNDMGNLLKEIKDPILSKYYDYQNFSQNLIHNQNIIDNIHKEKFSLELKNKLENKKRNSNFDVISVFKFNSIRSIINNFLFKHQGIFLEKNFSKILDLFKSETKNKGINFIVVYLPEYFRFLEKDYYNKKYYNYGDVIKLLNDKKIYTIDIIEEIKKNKINPKELYPFEMAGHFSEHGYKVVSEIIYRNLIEAREN